MSDLLQPTTDFECLLQFHPSKYTWERLTSAGAQGNNSKWIIKEEHANDGLPESMALKQASVRRQSGKPDLRECKILRECKHRNVITMFYWAIGPPNDSLLIYTELCDFDLPHFVHDRTFDTKAIKVVCKQLIVGCEYLHGKKIIHHDIKPENILVRHKGEQTITEENTVVKLTDFALARFVSADDASSSNLVQFDDSLYYTFSGTTDFASPEVQRAFSTRTIAELKSTTATDIFSSGVVIFQMITKKKPFGIQELCQESFDIVPMIRDNVWIPEIAKGLLKMLRWDRESRPKAKSLVKYFSEQYGALNYEVVKMEPLLEGFEPSQYCPREALQDTLQSLVVKCVKHPVLKNSLPNNVVLKRVPIKILDGTDIRESAILKQCNHPNILRLFYWETVNCALDEFSKSLYLRMYTEYADCNLQQYLARYLDRLGQTTLSVSRMIRLDCQMLEACDYLHTNTVVHRDIKPQNVLVFLNELQKELPTLKLADFGLARWMPPVVRSSCYFSGSFFGTEEYASPEMIRARDKKELVEPMSSFATDIFSLGIVMFEMITKARPFTLKELGKQTFENVDGIVEAKIEDGRLAKCLTKMLQWDPTKRPLARNALAELTGDSDNENVLMH